MYAVRYLVAGVLSELIQNMHTSVVLYLSIDLLQRFFVYSVCEGRQVARSRERVRALYLPPLTSVSLYLACAFALSHGALSVILFYSCSLLCSPFLSPPSFFLLPRYVFCCARALSRSLSTSVSLYIACALTLSFWEHSLSFYSMHVL